jgi:hypothetical protein
MREISAVGLVCYKLLYRLDIWFYFNCFEIVIFNVYNNAAFSLDVVLIAE